MRNYLSVSRDDYFYYHPTVTKENVHVKVWDDIDSVNDRPTSICFIKDKLIGKLWFKNGKLHRVTGPAFIFYKTNEYFLNGKKFSKKKWDKERLKHL